jgi:hypothetical protein
MDTTVLRRLLTRPFTPFDIITLSGHEYLVEDPKHCRLVDDTAVVWDHSGDLQLIDLKLVERVRLNDTFGFSDFETILK